MCRVTLGTHSIRFQQEAYPLSVHFLSFFFLTLLFLFELSPSIFLWYTFSVLDINLCIDLFMSVGIQSGTWGWFRSRTTLWSRRTLKTSWRASRRSCTSSTIRSVYPQNSRLLKHLFCTLALVQSIFVFATGAQAEARTQRKNSTLECLEKLLYSY